MGGKGYILILALMGCAEGVEYKELMLREAGREEAGKEHDAAELQEEGEELKIDREDGGDAALEYAHDALVEAECFIDYDEEIFGQMIIDLHTPELARRCASEEPQNLTVYKEQPYMVFLKGMAGEEYCIDVTRSSGYITISHRTGTVTREENIFTWCTVHGTQSSERFLIRSLTPSSSVSLAVEQGQ